MVFWRIDNIDVWLLGGVIFSIFWAILKAIEHDYDKILPRVKELEYNQELMWKKLRRIKSAEKRGKK